MNAIWVVLTFLFLATSAIRDWPLVQLSEKSAIRGAVLTANSDSPVAKAEITALREATKEKLVTLSDEKGYFSFTNLEEGTYILRAERNGYLSQTYGQHSNGHGITVLTLRRGQVLEQINFHLIQTGVMTGRVWGDDGEPQVNARVIAFVMSFVGVERRLLVAREVSTDDRGEYRIFGLSPGRYYICASAMSEPRGNAQSRKGPQPDEYIPTFFPNAGSITESSSVDIRSGTEERGIDIALRRSAVYQIRGTVLGGEQSTQRSRLYLRSTNPGYDAAFSGREVLAGPDGTFQFSGIMPGAYVIEATFGREGNGYADWQSVDITSSDVDGLRLTPTTGFRLPGRLHIVGASPVDFRKLRVLLHPTVAHLDSSPRSAEVNSDGTFLLQGIIHDMYEVRVAGLPQEFYLQSVYLGAEEAASKKVKLDFPGAQSSRLELRLSSDGAQINGTVSEDDNKPAAGFMVALVPNADFRDDQQLFRNVVTDQNGKFTIRGIAPGAYKLFAWDDIATDAYMNPEFLRPYENQGTSVTLLANDRKTVELRIIKSKAPVS